MIQDVGPIHCSAGDIEKTDACKKMIGMAIANSNMEFRPAKAVQRKMPATSKDYRYVAYVKDAKGDMHIIKLDKN